MSDTTESPEPKTSRSKRRARSPTRVLIVDDHAMVRDGLRVMLSEDDLEVVGEAADGDEAIEVARELKPDVILMDVRMPRMDGLTATKAIKEEMPETSVIMCTTYENKDYLRKAIEAGAAGYLLKGVSRDRLVNSVRLVTDGGSFVDADLLTDLLREISPSSGATQGATSGVASLSPREKEVLDLLARGLTNKEIAREIDYSVGTVKNVVQRIIEKLGVSDRTQAAVKAVRSGMSTD